MKSVGHIYCVTCLLTGKLYFGQTVKPIEKRWKHHIKYAQSGCQYKLHRAIRKYGVENFTVEEVMWVEADDRQVLNSKLDFLERFFIKRFNTRYDGFNMTDGGEGFSLGSLSPTHRLNLSRAKKGKKRGNFTDEWKRKIGESCKNHPTPYKGKPLSQEHRRRISQGVKEAYETGRKARPNLKGSNNPFASRKHSEESKRKMREAWKIRKLKL